MPDLLEEAKRLSAVEALAREFHAIYQAEAKRQGDVRHHDDYDALPENIKEFDRVLARRVLEREAELVERLEQAERKAERGYDLATTILKAFGASYTPRKPSGIAVAAARHFLCPEKWPVVEALAAQQRGVEGG